MRGAAAMRTCPFHSLNVRTAIHLLLLAGAVLPAACERAPERAPERPAEGAPVQSDPALYPVEIEPGTALGVRRVGSRQYMLYGSTDRATAVEVTVEDGHNVLFGPATVPVQDSRFRIDFVTAPTDRDHVFLYLTDATGSRLAVVPVDTARELTTAGPAERLPAPPGMEVAAPGDRRTHVSRHSLESPHLRIRWPEVREGDRSLHLRGETDLAMLRVEVRRQGRLLVVQQPRVPGPAGAWNAFATELVVPAGIREGDTVVIAPAERPGAAELIFQPIRN
jgi:hypothetical protein